MPIVISEKEIDWHETENKIVIIVQLSSRVDVKPSILITSKYLKVSCPPFIWEGFLLYMINTKSSIGRVTSDCVTLELYKCVPELWHRLSHPQTEYKYYCKEQREAALKEIEEYLGSSLELKCRKKQEIHKESVQKQMELDNHERELIKREKELENQKVAAVIQRKKEQYEANLIGQKRKQLLQVAQQIPPTRQSGRISVTFTPRVFPTAARESQESEENEWLKKQHEASASLKLDISDLSPEERNPEWLKSKAESMLKMEDYRSAVSAYSLALRMCPLWHSLHLGRSLCHLKLGNLHKTIEDSSKALELLSPEVPSNANDRKQAYEIRGKAFHQLQLPVEGLMDLEAALKIDKTDEDLKAYAAKLKLDIENYL